MGITQSHQRPDRAASESSQDSLSQHSLSEDSLSEDSLSQHSLSLEELADQNPLACERCRKVLDNPSYCDGCSMIICDPCWNSVLFHSKDCVPRYWQRPHQKITGTVDINRILLVRNILNAPKLQFKKVEQRHLQDRHTKWFGISTDSEHLSSASNDFENGGVVLETTQRLENLLNSVLVKADGASIHPRIVTFLGTTGSGKSTLIKALIKMMGYDTGQIVTETPVPQGGLSQQEADYSISADVHLYADPRTLQTPSPILFADCEGLDGSSGLLPVAENTWKTASSTVKGSVLGLGERYQPRFRKIQTQPNGEGGSTNKREILSNRRYVAESIYPQILYSVSDTIIYVAKDYTVNLTAAIETLLRWGKKALQVQDSTEDQPRTTLPYLLIVYNDSRESKGRIGKWGPDQLNNSTLNAFGKQCVPVEDNEFMSTLAEEYSSPTEAPINTFSDLLKKYYADVRFLAVPKGDQSAALACTQLKALYEEISTPLPGGRSSEGCERVESNTRMSLSYDQLVSCLEKAFDDLATRAPHWQ